MHPLFLLVTIALGADDPTERGRIALRLVRLGHAVIADVSSASHRMYIAADRVEYRGAAGIAAIPLPSDPHSRALVLPHAAASLLADAQPTAPLDRVLIRVSAEGPRAERVAEALLDAGFGLSDTAHLGRLCLQGARIAFGRGDRCGLWRDASDPTADGVRAMTRLTRAPPPEPASLAPRPAIVTDQAAPKPDDPPGSESWLRLGIGPTVDSTAALGLNLDLVRHSAVRWRIDLGATMDSAHIAAGAGVGLGAALSIDLVVGLDLEGDRPGWRVGLPITVGDRLELALVPGLSPRGFDAMLRISLPLAALR